MHACGLRAAAAPGGNRRARQAGCGFGSKQHRGDACGDATQQARRNCDAVPLAHAGASPSASTSMVHCYARLRQTVCRVTQAQNDRDSVPLGGDPDQRTHTTISAFDEILTRVYHEQDLQEVVRQADIVIAAAGRPGMLRGSWLKHGATVIDVGTNVVDDASRKSGYRLVGDADFDSCAEVRRSCAHILRLLELSPNALTSHLLLIQSQQSM